LNPLPLSKVSVAGKGPPVTSPVSDGEPASIPLLRKLRIWSDADCETKGPGLNWKSSDPEVPEIALVIDTYLIFDIGRRCCGHEAKKQESER